MCNPQFHVLIPPICTFALGMLAVWHRGLISPRYFLSIARPLPLSPPPFTSCSELMLIILALIDGPVRSPGWPSYSDVAAVTFRVTFSMIVKIKNRYSTMYKLNCVDIHNCSVGSTE
jgi:hypothetical protein